MKKFLTLNGLLLFVPAFLNAAEDQARPSPVQTTLGFALKGTSYALTGVILDNVVNALFSEYSRDFPPVITPTTKTTWALGALGFAGAALVAENYHINRNEPSSFEPLLSLEDEHQKRLVGKALEGTIVAVTAYSILTGVFEQKPSTAVACAAAGGLAELLIGKYS